MTPDKNIIYAVDFDGTLSLGRWPELGEPNLPLIRFLQNEQDAGARLILYTCRTGHLLDEAVRYCGDLGLEFDAVNDNLPELIELYGNNSRKISADIYIDDHAINPRPFQFIETIKIMDRVERGIQT